MPPLRAILLVEDNPDDERLTLRALRRGKIANEILIARNGEEALEIIFKLNTLPTVVLLDLKLPKIDVDFRKHGESLNFVINSHSIKLLRYSTAALVVV